MVNLIPAKIYLVKDAEHTADSKHFHNKKGKAPKQSTKEASKKAKRLKLEPDSQKTIEQLQEEERAKSALVVEAEGGGESKDALDGRTDPCSVEKVRSVGLNELREKLKKRLDGLRKRRRVDEEEEGGQVDPERAQKRQKRIEARKKKKEKRKSMAAKQSSTEKQIAQPSRPSVQDQEGRVVYSKFDFSVPMDWKQGPKKNYHSLLKKAEAIQEKLDRLKKEDEKKGQELEDKLKWKRAMQQAKGVKVKDDPKLLKNTLKRVEKKKSQSRKQWEERTTNEQKMKDKRQEVRQKHIRERTEQKKTNKTKGGKGRKPGF